MADHPSLAVVAVARGLKAQLKGLGWSDTSIKRRTPVCCEVTVREFDGEGTTVTVFWDEDLQMVRVRREGDEGWGT